MTTPEQDDKDVLAAEYVLGTLDAEDRDKVRMLLGMDPSFAERVRQWEGRLGQLHAMVQAVEPPPESWTAIKSGISGLTQDGQFWLPPVDRAAPLLSASAATAPTQSGAGEAAEPRREGGAAATIALAMRAARWRRIALGTGAIAAALMAVVVLREVRPDMMPSALRPQERVVERVVEKPVEVVREVVRTVEVPAPRMAEFVAVLQKDASSPAFLLTVDVEKRSFSMRRVGAEDQANKSYELWLISGRYPAPRSLGVVGEEEFTVRRALSDYDAPTLNAATYAVSLEPQGGSPSGAPTGPVLFTGKLLQTTPAGFPNTAP